MRKLNPREAALALALGTTAFLLLNLFFLPKLIASNRVAKQRGIELRSQLTAAEGWVRQEAYWRERREWLEKTEPTLDERGNATASQLEDLQKTARDSGLALNDLELLSLAQTEFYHPVGVKFTAVGPWPALVRFLAKYQQPDLFDVIPRISIRSDQEPPNVQCEMELQRWFHNPPPE